MIKNCDKCARCIVCGYRPVRDAVTISCACDVKPGHVYPSDDECDTWAKVDPWERAKVLRGTKNVYT